MKGTDQYGRKFLVLKIKKNDEIIHQVFFQRYINEKDTWASTNLIGELEVFNISGYLLNQGSSKGKEVVFSQLKQLITEGRILNDDSEVVMQLMLKEFPKE